MKYQPEIDGLRSLAVLPVILFHAGFRAFSGGFVGVDVFFVISGYLISSLIMADLQAGRFSLLTFYERRARRILPALFVVVAACMPFAAAWMLPQDRLAFSHSVAAVAVFASNILFWRESGYFDAAGELKPLLHTWSLAVEEQYYVLFPLFLMLAWRLGRRWVAAIVVVVALCSLALGQWAATNNPSAGFFLLPTRAWELLLGVLAAMWRPQASQPVRQIASGVGLAMVLYAVFAFDHTTPTPGLPTLIPTIGAAAIILCARDDTWSGRLLSSPLFVGLGLVSYSAYLWHQPLFAFARLRSIEAPSPAVFAALALAALALAYLTWRYVETPLRRRARRIQVFGWGAAATLAVFTVGATASMTLPREELAQPTNGRCNVGVRECFSSGPGSVQVVLWGDSYADALAVSLGKRLAREGITLRLLVANSCPSVLGVVRNEPGASGAKFSADCEHHNAQALRTIQQIKPQHVVLTSAYQVLLTGKNASGEPLLVDRARPQVPPEVLLPQALRKAVEAVGTHTIVVLPHPVVADFEQARKRVQFGQANQVYADYAAASKARSVLLTTLAGVDQIDPRPLLCRGEVCPVLVGGSLLLYDGKHMSQRLADRVAGEIVQAILGQPRSVATAQGQ